MSEFRLIVDPPNSGDWNMAADEVLLQNADRSGQGTLRFYQWSEPTLSLGYFQSHDERHRHAASTACPLIRRSSGGGAIVHDHELTYSLTLPLQDRWSQNAEELYATVHNSLIETLRLQDIACVLHVGKPQTEAFLCFQRRAEGDVILKDNKIMGSAQRRTKYGILQHGSLLLQKSTVAPELPGLAEIVGCILSPSEIVKNWKRSLTNRFSTGFREDIFASEEVEQIKSLAGKKYRQDEWTFRR